MGQFPIFAKLNPFNRKNLPHLMATAVIARAIVAVIRVALNRPSQHKDPNLSPNQKRQAMIERFFVEVCGTSAYIGALHFGQDLMSKIFERGLHLPQITGSVKGLSAGQVDTVNKAIVDVFGHHPNLGADSAQNISKGLISRNLFGETAKGVVNGEKTLKDFVHANLASLKAKLCDMVGDKAQGEALFQTVRDNFVKPLESGETVKVLDDFMMRLNRSTSWSIAGGVALSVLLGGFVTQRMNDNVVAPAARKALNKMYPDGVKPINTGPLEAGNRMSLVSEAPAMAAVPSPSVANTSVPPASMAGFGAPPAMATALPNGQPFVNMASSSNAASATMQPLVMPAVSSVAAPGVAPAGTVAAMPPAPLFMSASLSANAFGLAPLRGGAL